jgi:uncharacterized protein (DUF1786 family)
VDRDVVVWAMGKAVAVDIGIGREDNMVYTEEVEESRGFEGGG